jgi:hypothetical protein
MFLKIQASFTRSGFWPVSRFRLSLDKVVEHRKAWAYSHSPVVCPAGNLPASTRSNRLLCPVAESTVVHVLLIDTFTHSRFYPAGQKTGLC